MIKYVSGDLFKSETQTIVNTVNCVGAMGAGIALEFKNRYPNMFYSYKKICDSKLLFFFCMIAILFYICIT